MLVIGVVALIKGRRLKTYLMKTKPELFAELYGNGTIFGKSIRNDIARTRFVHSGRLAVDADPRLRALRYRVRAVERLYLLAFGVTVAFFIGFLAVAHASR
jgi:hypothetical protein